MGTPKDEEIRTLAKQIYIHQDTTPSYAINSAEDFVDAADRAQEMRIKTREMAEAAELAKKMKPSADVLDANAKPHVPEPARAVHNPNG